MALVSLCSPFLRGLGSRDGGGAQSAVCTGAHQRPSVLASRFRPARVVPPLVPQSHCKEPWFAAVMGRLPEIGAKDLSVQKRALPPSTRLALAWPPPRTLLGCVTRVWQTYLREIWRPDGISCRCNACGGAQVPKCVPEDEERLEVRGVSATDGRVLSVLVGLVVCVPSMWLGMVPERGRAASSQCM